MRIPTLAFTSVLSATAAVVGSLGVRTDTLWYRTIDKPRWQPPGAVFPIVWTPLYAGIAYGTARAADAEPASRDRFLALTAADLTLNAGWNWAFFDRQSPPAGMAVITALHVMNVALLRQAKARDDRAATALAPYVAWTAFATLLNASIWWRNRR
jgi:benzodiazapine receptor